MANKPISTYDTNRDFKYYITDDCRYLYIYNESKAYSVNIKPEDKEDFELHYKLIAAEAIEETATYCQKYGQIQMFEIEFELRNSNVMIVMPFSAEGCDKDYIKFVKAYCSDNGYSFLANKSFPLASFGFYHTQSALPVNDIFTDKINAFANVKLKTGAMHYIVYFSVLDRFKLIDRLDEDADFYQSNAICTLTNSTRQQQSGEIDIKNEIAGELERSKESCLIFCLKDMARIVDNGVLTWGVGKDVNSLLDKQYVENVFSAQLIWGTEYGHESCGEHLDLLISSLPKSIVKKLPMEKKAKQAFIAEHETKIDELAPSKMDNFFKILNMMPDRSYVAIHGKKFIQQFMPNAFVIADFGDVINTDGFVGFRNYDKDFSKFGNFKGIFDVSIVSDGKFIMFRNKETKYRFEKLNKPRAYDLDMVSKFSTPDEGRKFPEDLSIILKLKKSESIDIIFNNGVFYGFKNKEYTARIPSLGCDARGSKSIFRSYAFPYAINNWTKTPIYSFASYENKMLLKINEPNAGEHATIYETLLQIN
ncbi:MAG: hypothetical protein AAGU21_06490 [Solidesulfovibrio sp.]|uniref:hypothetical protein n=1 Tax=Solidesulfovibrio sp. TaxID=2910990 RepID=UPI0031598EB5